MTRPDVDALAQTVLDGDWLDARNAADALVERVRELEAALDRIEAEPEDALTVQGIARAALGADS